MMVAGTAATFALLIAMNADSGTGSQPGPHSAAVSSMQVSPALHADRLIPALTGVAAGHSSARTGPTSRRSSDRVASRADCASGAACATP